MTEDKADDIARVHTQRTRYMERKHFKLFGESCLEAGVNKDLVQNMQDFVTKNADQNGDGKIDKREFAEFLRKNEKFGVFELEAISAVMYTKHPAVDFQETKVGIFEYDKYGNLIAQHDRFGGYGGYGGSGYGVSYGHSFKSHTVALDDRKGKVRRPLIVIAGPPAGGKGTLCKKIVKKYNFVHLSTGAMLRERAKTDVKLAQTMASGGLVNDRTVFKILSEAISKIKSGSCGGVLLDGFPRNKSQADMLRDANFLISHFLLLDVEDDECKKRVLARAKASKTPRKDDTSEVIVKRLAVYHSTIASFSACYKAVTIKIDGNGSKDQVWDACDKAMSSANFKPVINVVRKTSGHLVSKRPEKSSQQKKREKRGGCVVM